MPDRVGADGRKTTLSWYIGALKKYAIFNGRSRRLEYWTFTLINALILAGLGYADASMGNYPPLLSALYGLAVLIPAIAVTVRRLHDTDRSAWWLLIILVPAIGQLVLLVFMLIGGKRDRNQYGPDPKGLGVRV